MQVLSTNLPDGRRLGVRYDGIAHAALSYYHAGIAMGQVPKGQRGEPGRAANEAHEKARKRCDEASNKLEEAITEAMAQAVTDAWEAAISTVHPFKCGHCSVRFETMPELVAHATVDTAMALCRESFEQALRFTSSLAPVRANVNGS